MKIVLLTVGTRGDVEPFLALGRGLQRAGHDVAVCTTEGFRFFVEQQGLRYLYLNNELVELTSTEVGRKGIEDFGKGPVGKLRWIAEAARQFKPIFRRLLREQWDAAQGAELIVFHPNAVGGVHLAEALGIPGVMADPMPTWVPTGEFPSFVFPELPLGRRYNRLTYRLLPALTRGMYGSVVTRWRRETLGLPPRPRLANDMERTDGRPVPVLLAFSRHVVPPPADWPPTVTVTGYWFLDGSSEWQPPEALLHFLATGPEPVLVGFGSMAGRYPEKLGRLVVEALRRAGQRGIVVTGWGGVRIPDPPAHIFTLDSAPYDWLLPRVAAVVHHGGAGTTAAGLRAGKPSVICPFVADQPFWGARVAALGAGPAPIPQRRLTASNLAERVRMALADPDMRRSAARLGEKIRAEDGVGRAVERIEEIVRGSLPFTRQTPAAGLR